MPAAESHKSHRAAEPPRELRQRFREGDPEAFDQLAEAFFDDATRFCLALLRDEELAMEAVQETFLRAIERHRLFDAARDFRPWFFKVCRNCCLELRRKGARRSARVVPIEPTGDEIAQLADDAPAAFEELLRRERESEALRLLGFLDEPKREVVVLRLFEELTFRDIADTTGRSPNTVASVYYRSLAELRDRAESEGYFNDDNQSGRSGHAS